MAFQHNYITGSARKPTADATSVGELVINGDDGSLRTKNPQGEVVNLVGGTLDTSWSTVGHHVPYLSGFTNNYGTLRFRHISNNTVHVAGVTGKAGSSGSTSFHIFTFPEEIRTRLSGSTFAPVLTWLGARTNAYAQVNMDGNFNIVKNSNTSTTSLIFSIDMYIRLV